MTEHTMLVMRTVMSFVRKYATGMVLQLEPGTTQRGSAKYPMDTGRMVLVEGSYEVFDQALREVLLHLSGRVPRA